MLADFVSPSAIFYGTVVPLAVYNIARILIVNPYLKQQKDKELKRKQEGQSEQLARVKREAQMAVELMTESVAKVVRDEEAKRGNNIQMDRAAIFLLGCDCKASSHVCCLNFSLC